ncbi:MAG: serine hydrolase domain-containing protein [Limisphaerales bacterium]
MRVESAEARIGVDFDRLESRLERLRKRWDVPGMAAGFAISNKVVWQKEFGFADLKTRRPVTPETVFHLASLTKPFAAVVLLQLVEGGQLDLAAPVEQYGVRLKENGVQVRHLLTHTSEGTLGEVYRYSGERFAELGKVLRAVTGKSFAQVVSERILEPLALTNTSPNPFAPEACAEAKRDAALFLERSAKGYAFDGETPVEYRKHFVTAAGLVSNVKDVLRFSCALDDGELLKQETLEMAYAPAKSPKGKELAYGLGWFIQKHKGTKLVWHYGWDRANSTLIIKIPEREVTFLLLGNSEALSRKFDLGQDEKVTRSPFAREFLKAVGIQ